MKRLLAALTLTLLPPALALADTTAKQTTEAFYTWYLQSFSQDKVPLNDDLQQMKAYVADSLLDGLRKQMASDEGLEEDYFIKSQDYDDSWLTHINVTERTAKGTSAIEDVVLGTTQDNSVALNVTLNKVKDGWRIVKVDGVKTGLTPD
ncbi:DUF3828 domain-containing protein [Pseudomonas typographi]|uniref:DUF3828 domain-containing protein n=1 Tax=Pseudomonas typographi TaxID=2715964 RepID=A0ABR7Z8C4_9PSED|nr:DUF3828 domain-containing protein [Pseudomonas typographi]MBD1551898.1 DUF3828 domain-containing protein [Pseudomonas typographi]MBD1589849.1 DUF3828 domain-containing protein [Pseudomonas typographi]MBD1601554.1 DUF3828 domain-containing protein [Pseudomonas typographi]